MNKNIFISLIGVIIMLFGMWGGAFLCEVFPFSSGYNLAAFFTGCMFFVIGVLIASVGVIQMSEK